jgi:hypothetical protein
VTGELGKLHEELHNLITMYYYGDQIKQNEIGRSCSTHGGGRNAEKILVGTPRGKRPFRRS